MRPVGADGTYPERFAYAEERRELHVGDGVFCPVAPEAFSFRVSGLHVVGSWLGYRMSGGAGKKSSPLDDIGPERWPAAFTEELLRLLWVIEHTVALQPALDETLDAIVAAETSAESPSSLRISLAERSASSPASEMRRSTRSTSAT